MIRLKIQAEADTLRELSDAVEHLRRQYVFVLVRGVPRPSENSQGKLIQDIEVEKDMDSN
jgi:hypothetical protein